MTAYLLVNTGMTVLSVPHTALAGELSGDLDERTELFGWRFLFANLGLMVGILLPGVFARVLGADSVSLVAGPASLIVAVILVVAAVITFRGTRGLDRPAPPVPPDRSGFLRAWRDVIANRVFLPLLLAFIVGSMGRTINSAVALYYYEYRLALEETRVFLSILLPFTLVIALSIIGWHAISKRIGKKKPAVFGVLVLGVYTCIAYPLFPTGRILPPLLGGLFGGLLIGSVFLMDSAVADVVDEDELRSGEHREGLYFGVWRMGTKLARALGLAFSGFLLEWIGFRSDTAIQSPDTITGLAWLFGPGVGVWFIFAALILMRFPLDRAGSQKILAQLDSRR